MTHNTPAKTTPDDSAKANHLCLLIIFLISSSSSLLVTFPLRTFYSFQLNLFISFISFVSFVFYIYLIIFHHLSSFVAILLHIIMLYPHTIALFRIYVPLSSLLSPPVRTSPRLLVVHLSDCPTVYLFDCLSVRLSDSPSRTQSLAIAYTQIESSSHPTLLL